MTAKSGLWGLLGFGVGTVAVTNYYAPQAHRDSLKAGQTIPLPDSHDAKWMFMPLAADGREAYTIDQTAGTVSLTVDPKDGLKRDKEQNVLGYLIDKNTHTIRYSTQESAPGKKKEVALPKSSGVQNLAAFHNTYVVPRTAEVQSELARMKSTGFFGNITGAVANQMSSGASPAPEGTSETGSSMVVPGLITAASVIGIAVFGFAPAALAIGGLVIAGSWFVPHAMKQAEEEKKNAQIKKDAAPEGKKTTEASSTTQGVAFPDRPPPTPPRPNYLQQGTQPTIQ